jgi:hypothetical protein
VSYQVTKTVRISGTASGSVDYPASEKGGSTHASISWSENVTVNILVDTKPFDRSIGQCKGHLGLLTGGIVAAGLAHVKAKADAASRISGTIIKGFFGFIRQEIQQQMTELAARIPMLLSELKRRAEDCLGKRNQMRVDYERISGRYGALFTDLDKHMEKAVRQIDQHCFLLFDRTAGAIHSNATSLMPSVALVSSNEVAASSNTLIAAGIKRTAGAIIQSARGNIAKGIQLRNQVQEILTEHTVSRKTFLYAPVLTITHDDLETPACHVLQAKAPDPLTDNSLGSRMENAVADLPPEHIHYTRGGKEKQDIDEFLRKRISVWISAGSGKKVEREAAEMMKMWVQSLGNLNA